MALNRSSKANIAQAIAEKLEQRIDSRVKSAMNTARSVGGVKKMAKATKVEGLAPFSGVSELSLAPVNIGNTIRAVKQSVFPSRDGVRVVGRDFVTSIGGTAAVYTNWTFQAGFGLSPVCLNATGLRGYFQTYERYKWNAVRVHYITSSPTSTSGDILIFYHSNHGGPKVDHTSNNFMSYALSTDSAVIGPQWTNHSMVISPSKRDWLDTDLFNAEDVQHQADGEVLIYTRASTNGNQPDEPGYVLIDYDITFERRMLNPRVSTIPSSLFKYTPKTFNVGGGPVLAGDPIVFNMSGIGFYTGVAGVVPVGIQIGDVFQIVFDVQQAFITGASFGTSFAVNVSAGTRLIYPITTGTTLYAVAGTVTSPGSFILYANYDDAMTGVPMVWNAAINPAVSTSCTFVCVGSVTPHFAQANIS